ncbi:Bifunctional chorismate mutase/prephenate dehydratase, partial [Dysosmobacter welbionis]
SLFAGDLPLDRLVVVRPHPGIEAAGGGQLLMGALLHDAALLQHQNLVRTHDGGQAVGDHDNGAATGQLGERFLDQSLVLGVRKGGRLIEDHDGRVLQNGPGQGDALLLAAGEISPLGANRGVHTLGQLLQNVSALGSRQRREHLLPGSVGAGSPDIFKDGGFEQAAVLEHKGNLIHEHMGIDLPHIHAAHLHRAGGGVPEAGDQAGGRGLAAAGGPHQGHGLSRLRREGDMGEGGCLRAVVGEAHILKFHTAVPGLLRVVRIFQFRGAHNLINTAQGAAGQHDARCGEHDFGKGCGDDGGKHRVKGKVCDKPCEVVAGQSTRRQEQGRRNQEHKGPLGEGQVDGLGRPANIRLIVLGLGAVVLNSLLERLEGVDGLLED